MWSFQWNPVSFKNSMLSLLPAAPTLWSAELQLGGGAMATASLHLVKRRASQPNIPWSSESLLWPSISDRAYCKKLCASLPCNVFISFSSFVSLSGPWGHHQPSLPMPSLPGLPPPCPWPRSPCQPPGPSAPAPSTLRQGWSPAPALPGHESCWARPDGWGCPGVPTCPVPGCS